MGVMGNQNRQPIVRVPEPYKSQLEDIRDEKELSSIGDAIAIVMAEAGYDVPD